MVSCGIVRKWLVGGWFVLALALFGFVVTRQPLGQIGEACRAMGPAVLLAPVVGLMLLATRTTVLELVLAGRVGWRELVRVRMVGDGYNALVPAAGLAGEPYKLRQLARWLPVDRAVTGLVRDRMVDNALGLVVSAGGIAVALPGFAVPVAARDALWTYAAVAGPAGVVLLVVALTRVPGRFGAVVTRWFRRSPRELEHVSRSIAVRIVGWALATRALQMVETALLLACIGAPVGAPSVLLVDGALNAAGFVGFLMPQGLGVVEGTAIYLLGALGSPAAAATAFALARRGRVIAVSGAGVALHLGGQVAAWVRAASSLPG